MASNKPIIVLDFDGVIHSYSSGWKGASVIPDEPVPGAIEFILNARKSYQIAILSSRSHQWGGKRAMKRWLRNALIEWTEREICQELGVESLTKMKMAGLGCCAMEPWDVEVKDWADDVIKSILWPWFKPPALVTIDDRAIPFDGEFPKLEDIARFKPWNKWGV